MDKLPRRKNTRLKNYDYSQAGCYFITICTNNRSKVLSNIVGGGFHAAPRTELTLIGKEVVKTIDYIEDQNLNIIFDKYIIMPNHIHLLIKLHNEQLGGHGLQGTPELIPTEYIKVGNPPLHKIVGQLKSYTNKKYNEINKTKKLILWQRNYYDHIIRNEEEYQEIWRYIETNPIKWEEDEYYK